MAKERRKRRKIVCVKMREEKETRGGSRKRGTGNSGWGKIADRKKRAVKRGK